MIVPDSMLIEAARITMMAIVEQQAKEQIKAQQQAEAKLKENPE